MEKPFAESWFYAPLQGIGDQCALSVEDTHHFGKVLRLQVGRQVVASNGIGGVYHCETKVENGKINLIATEWVTPVLPHPKVDFVLSYLKGRDLEEPVEGLCQTNVRGIHLVTTDHSQEIKGQNQDRLMERLRGKSLVGLKQAKKAWLTEVHDPMPLPAWRKKFADLPLIVLHPGNDTFPEGISGGFAVLTGPEGGFSKPELDWLHSEGCGFLSLGETRIRGTHAPLLACGKLMGIGLLSVEKTQNSV